MESKVYSEIQSDKQPKKQTDKQPKKSRKAISKSLKNNVWLQYYGEKFTCKCSVTWCVTPINPFTFEVGHNMPHSKGGTLDIDNLKPICSTCNKSMGDRYTIDEFSKLANNKTKNPCCCIL
jgi:5-methylcytosine-specific restriction endonuclease McrA